MARLTRAHDWGSTPLGPWERWPASLTSAVRLMLGSSFPMFVWWGPRHVNLYNDAYAPILGHRHPQALGQPAEQVWSDIWQQVGPMAESVLREGRTVWNERFLLVMQRKGYTEETYFTFSYSPAYDDDGAIGGVFCTCMEETERVLGERRLQSLRLLSSATSDARSTAQACERAAQALAGHAADLPFVLVYLQHEDGSVRLAASAGAAADAPFAPLTAGLDAQSLWPFADAAAARAPLEVYALGARWPAIHAGPWPEPVESAVVLPLTGPTATAPAGFVVAGVSPRRRLDGDYRDYLSLVAQQISSSLADASAFEAEQRRAEALAELDRAKTAFFTNVSHEFRTPLALMLGPLEDLAERLPAGAQRELADTARRNAERLLKLVNTLLDFARIEGGRADPHFRPTDLAAYTAGLASNFRSACERAGLQLTVACEPLAQPVHVDRDLWEKVVLNLLSNAFKFTFVGGITVRVQPTADGRGAQVSVSDTGSGIAAADLPKLFQRFQRIEGARGRSLEGSGIGLSLVAEVVKLHHGRIEADSALGRGTTFTVVLPFGTAHLPADRVKDDAPRATPSTQTATFVGEALQWLPDGDAAQDEAGAPSGFERPAGMADGAPPRDAPRILVADDNRDMRDYLGHLLGGVYRVELATDGLEAWTLLQAQPPDLLLADVMMPRLDGFALVARLRADERLRTLPAILLSARAGEESRVEGLAAGADDYLVKPFAARELLARVSAHLAAARIRREAEAAVRASDQKFRALVTASSDVVYRMDADWTQLRYLEGRDFIEDTTDPSSTWLARYIPADEQPRVRAAIRAAIAARGVFELEHRVIRADGTQGWTFSRAIPILDADGRIVEWFGAASDVTRRKQVEHELQDSEERLRQADRRKDEFLATLAHELRNPLAPIRNAVHLLGFAEKGGNVGKLRDMLDRQVGHMVRLVDDLLEVSRITRGQIELQRERVSLTQVLQAAVESSRPLLDRARHRLTLTSAPETLWVFGDAVRLTQVFANLLNNAARYTEDGGEIELAVRREGAQAVVSVSDNGIGIGAEQLPRLFEMFSQLDRTHRRAQGGLGIGLSLVRRLLQMHDGSVEAASEGPGRGSRFTVRLPLYAGETAGRAAAAGEAPGLPVARVLIVDDNRDAADSTALLLGVQGADARVVYDGPAALETVRQWRPSVVLLDLGMPSMDGYEVARRIRAEPGHGDTVLVALTGWGQERDRMRTREAGFDHHLVKPVELQSLQVLLSAVQRQREGADPRASAGGAPGLAT